ncbi:MAG: LysR family transcriptional regulator [Flavobacteriales bacterium]
MNYTIHQLKIFVKITEKGSITRAAEELHLTQPAVSIQLKNLQEQFDIPLIQVIGRKIHVTQFGKEIALASKKILDEVEQIKHKKFAYQGLLYGNLKFSVVSTGKYVMPYFVAGFHSIHSGIDLQIDVTNRSSVLDSFQNNDSDFALVSVLPDSKNFENIELMANELYLIKKKGQKPLKSLDELNHLPLILREEGSATRLSTENFISKNKISPTQTIVLTSNEAVKQGVLSGLGYSLMPAIGLKNELENEELEIISLECLPIITKWNLIWQKEKHLSPIANAFIQYLKVNKNEIIKANFAWYQNFKPK